MSIIHQIILGIPLEVSIKILNRLHDKDLFKLSLTSKKINSFVDNNKNQLFSQTALQIIKRIKTVTTIETNLTICQLLNSHLKSSLLHRFIKLINDSSSQDFYSIFCIAKNSFSSVQRMASQHELSCLYMKVLSFLSLYLPTAKQLLRRDQLFYHRMEDLFGDIHAYEKVPLLDISNKKIGDYIDCIKPEDMTDSIMRGTDKYGRNFIAIKAIDKRGRLAVQTFFERSMDNNMSVSAGSDIIPFGYNWLKSDGTLNTASEHIPYYYEKLKTLIRVGEVSMVSLDYFNPSSPFFAKKEEHTICLSS